MFANPILSQEALQLKLGTNAELQKQLTTQTLQRSKRYISRTALQRQFNPSGIAFLLNNRC